MQSNSKLKKDLGSSSSRNCCYDRTTKALLELGLARGKIDESSALSGVEIGPWESQEEDQHNNKNALNSLNKYNTAVMSQQQQLSGASAAEKQQQQKRQEVSNLILKRRTLSQQRPSDALNGQKKKNQMTLIRHEISPLRNYILQQVTAAVAAAQQQSPPQRRLLSQEQLQSLIEKQQQWRQQQQFQEQQNMLLQREQQQQFTIEYPEMKRANDGQQYEFQQQQVSILQSQQQELMRLKMTDNNTKSQNKSCSNQISNNLQDDEINAEEVDSNNVNRFRSNSSGAGTTHTKHIAEEKTNHQAAQKQAEGAEDDCQMILQTTQDVKNISSTEEFIQQELRMNASRTSSNHSSLDNLKQASQQSPQKISTQAQLKEQEQGQQGQFKQYHQQTNSQQSQQQQQQQRSLEDKMQLCELQRLETFKKNILFKCLTHHGQKPLLSLDLLRNSKTSPLKKNNQKSTTTMSNTTAKNNLAMSGVNNNNNNNNHLSEKEESQIEGTNPAERSPDCTKGSSTNRAIPAVAESNQCNMIACSVVAAVCETVVTQPKQQVLLQQQQLQQEQIPDCLKKRTRSHHIPMHVASAKAGDSNTRKQGDKPQDESNVLVSQHCQTEAYDDVKRGQKSSGCNHNNKQNILKTEGPTEDVIVIKRRIHSLYSQNIEAQLADEAALIYHTNTDDQARELRRYHGNTFAIKSNKQENALRNNELLKINRSIDIVHQLKQLQLTTNPDRKRIILNARNTNNNRTTACNMRIGNSKWEFIEEQKKNSGNVAVNLKKDTAVQGYITPRKQYGFGMGEVQRVLPQGGKGSYVQVKAATDENRDQMLTSETKLATATTQQSMNVHSLSHILEPQDESDKQQEKDKQQQQCGEKIMSCCSEVISRDSHARKRMQTEGDAVLTRSIDKSARYQRDNQKKFELIREQTNGIVIGNNNNSKDYCQNEIVVGKKQQQQQQQQCSNSQDSHGFNGGYDAKTSLEYSAALRQKEKRTQRYCDDDQDESTTNNFIIAKQPTNSSYFGQQNDQLDNQTDYQSQKQQQQKTYQSPRLLPDTQVVSRKRTLPVIDSKSKSPERTTRRSQEGRHYYQPLQQCLEEQRCQLPLVVSSNRNEKTTSIGACVQQDNKGSNVVSSKQIEQLSSQIQLSAAKKLKFKLLNKKNDMQI